MQKQIEETSEVSRSGVLADEPQASSAGGVLRFLMPSVGDSFFVLLLAGLLWGPLARGLLADAGIGWHIRSGDLIVATHAVPRVDPFSSTMQDKPWYAWEWSFDLMASLLHHWAGLNGVALASALIIALTFAFLFRMMLARGTNMVVAIGLLMLGFAASTIHFFARPHIVSWLLMLIWFGILDRYENGGEARKLAWLPVLMLPWVNVHGGFVLGFVLLAIYLVAACLGWLGGRDAESRMASGVRVKWLSLAGLCALAVTLANPYGYKLHIHIYEYLSDRFLMDHIDEFLSPNFHGLPQKCFAAIILLAFLGVVAGRRRLCISHLLIILFAIYSGLYAARNIPTSSMLLVLLIAPLLSSWLREAAVGASVPEAVRLFAEPIESFSNRMIVLNAAARGYLWPLLAAVAGILICAHGGRLGAARVLTSEFSPSRFPVAAADLLDGSRTTETVFCPDRWGGYLIYRFYPGVRVAVDDRHDFYGAEFLQQYLKIMHGEDGWREALADMKARWVLVPSGSTVASLLDGRPGWRSVYQDDTAVLYRREGSF